MNDKDRNLTPATEESALEDHFGPQAIPLASTEVDLARLGLNEVAYIRQSLVDNVPMWTIHSASGTPMGAAHNLEQAWGAVVQHDLQPVHVH